MLSSSSGKVFVTDFDGTLTRHDFYQLALESLIPPDVENYWEAYRAGRISHFEALRLYFSEIQGSEFDVLAVLDQMELVSGLASAVNELEGAGWKIVVASAGCQWYIDLLLSRAGVELEVHANPGEFIAGRGLVMQMPPASPFRSLNLGVDKAAIVKHYQDRGCLVGFAGDGFPDVEAARLVPPRLRFARRDLAEVLQREQLPFRRFEIWTEIARSLLEENN